MKVATSLGARDFAARDELPVQRNLRSRLLSAGRSYLFNRVLAQRVADGSWAEARVGDLLAFTDSRSFFPAAEAECSDPRLAILDLHPTGPLWGEGARRRAPRSRRSRMQWLQVKNRSPIGWRRRG